MKQLDNNTVNNAKVIQMNRNSVVLELQPNERILCSRKVFNMIRKNPEIPMFSIEREFQGMTNEWIAIPMTV